MPEEKLKKYNETNFEKDLKQMQPFLKVNQLEPKKFYLLFIYDLETYTNNLEYAKINQKFKFQFIYFSMKELKFNYLIHKDFIYELKAPKNLDDYSKIKEKIQIKFIKEYNFSLIPNDYIGPKYYTYYDCTFKSFMKKFFQDFLIINEKFLEGKEKFILKYYGTIDGLKKKEFNILTDNANIIFIYIIAGDIIYVNGEYKNKKYSFGKKCKLYQNFFYTEIESDLKFNVNGYAFFNIQKN